MKVAATAERTDCSSPIDPHFARTRYFLIIDLGSNASAVRDKTDLQRLQFLAGTQAASSLISLGVDAVITMKIGPKAFATFKSAGVQVFQARPGTVAGVIELFQAGRLQEFAGHSVEEYWPHEVR